MKKWSANAAIECNKNIGAADSSNTSQNDLQNVSSET